MRNHHPWIWPCSIDYSPSHTQEIYWQFDISGIILGQERDERTDTSVPTESLSHNAVSVITEDGDWVLLLASRHALYRLFRNDMIW